MMLPSFDGEEEVGSTAIGADPRAVQAYTRGDGTKKTGNLIFNHIDHCLAGFRLRYRMLLIIRFDMEFDILGATCRSCAIQPRLILSRRRQNEKKDCQQ